MPAPPSSTSTATTSGPAGEARRSPLSYGCWRPWTSPPRPRAPRGRAWAGGGGCGRDGAPPAARTAVSRMVRQGWLSPVRLPQGRGYALTTRAVRRLDEAGRRIYRDAPDTWDGRWHLLVIQHIPERARRERLRAGLGYLGYAPLDDTTWISPR